MLPSGTSFVPLTRGRSWPPSRCAKGRERPCGPPITSPPRRPPPAAAHVRPHRKMRTTGSTGSQHPSKRGPESAPGAHGVVPPAFMEFQVHGAARCPSGVGLSHSVARLWAAGAAVWPVRRCAHLLGSSVFRRENRAGHAHRRPWILPVVLLWWSLCPPSGVAPGRLCLGLSWGTRWSGETCNTRDCSAELLVTPPVPGYPVPHALLAHSDGFAVVSLDYYSFNGGRKTHPVVETPRQGESQAQDSWGAAQPPGHRAPGFGGPSSLQAAGTVDVPGH